MNGKTNENVAQKKRTRRLAVAAAAMLLAAVGIFSTISSLQRRATAVARPAYIEAPDITPVQKVEIRARATWLRDKWRSWALSHREELTRMLRAKPDDTAALDRIWNTLPNVFQSGIHPQELCPTGDPFVGVGFSWEPAGRFAVEDPTDPLKPEVSEVLRKGKSVGAKWRQDRFFDIRDVVVSDSLTPGHTHIQLWASGRVTEQQKLPASERPNIKRKLQALGRGPRQSDLYGSHHEVLPPFDFLPQTSESQTNYVKE